jgi:hypothetical protein
MKESKIIENPGPVIVPAEMGAGQANQLYGEAYGIDWMYEVQAPAPATPEGEAPPWLPTQEQMAWDGAAGVALVSAERGRQIAVKGWMPDHDDAHTTRELAYAGDAYLQHYLCPSLTVPTIWPWDDDAWNPKPDQLRNLVRAGALICAEIDRVIREGCR